MIREVNSTDGKRMWKGLKQLEAIPKLGFWFRIKADASFRLSWTSRLMESSQRVQPGGIHWYFGELKRTSSAGMAPKDFLGMPSAGVFRFWVNSLETFPFRSVGYGICCRVLKRCRYLYFTARMCTYLVRAAVDVTSQNCYPQLDSDQGALLTNSSRHVDSQIESQMGTGGFTVVVLFAVINMTFVVVFEDIVSLCIFHIKG